MRKVVAAAAIGAIALAVTLARRGRPRRNPVLDPDSDSGASNQRIATVTNGYMMYVVLPMWIVPGFGDWLCHRAAKIERTSGTHESLTHSLMMTCVGVPTLMALFLEINAGMLLAFAGALLAHEAVVIWDVAYAAGRREVTATEQHCHSFLEVLPFMSLSFLLCVHSDQLLAIVGRGTNRADYSLRLKSKLPSPGYVISIVALTGAFLGVPYAEELARCYSVDGTFAPHDRKPDRSLPLRID